ncbi:MAG TPA: M1 family aminopeptidase [Candidatus Acidoferrales bacterium]|nr:M1 family aminopeptidase [Candidatus Acidoferrales bacterium]
MPGFARSSPVVVSLVLSAAWIFVPPRIAALQPAPEQAQTPPAQAIPADPRALYQALNALRPDPVRVYSVRSLSLRRDVINLTFDEGKLAFLQPLGGRITGVVFAGRGHAIATPHDAGERRSLAQFVGVPILDQTFSRAYLRFDDATAEEIEKDLQNAGDAVTNDPDFTANWETLFASANPAHSLRVMEDWLASEPVPYFEASILSDTRGTIDMVLDGRQYEQVLFGQPRIANGVPSYDVWASFRAVEASSASGEGFVPLDYNVDTRIADDLSLDATTTLHLKAKRGGERVVPLELSRNLAVTGIKGGNGAPLVYFQNEDLSQREIQSRGNDTLLVVLPSALPLGAEFPLEVSYHGSVISDAGNGVQYVGEHQTWYAHVGRMGHFAPFRLSFRWPKRFSLIATGRKIESHDDGEFETGRWSSDVPFAVAGFNLGDYETETVGNGHPNVELYANRQLEGAILDRLQRHQLQIPISPEQSHRPGFAGSIPPNSQPPPNPAAVLKNLGGEVLDSIHFFESLNGPFPFSDLKISQIPGSVGQGWPGLVYLSTLAFLPPEAEERAGIGQQTQALAREVMPFHEVAHQWWGNVTAAATYRDVWIQEGMANYLSLMYADEQRPPGRRMAVWLERYRSELTSKAPATGETVEESGPLTLGYRLESSKNSGAYETVIYGKGMWVMHMIREMLRDPADKDPDARFHDLLHSILAQYRFKPMSTAEFQRAVEQHMTPAMDLDGNHSMNWFFGEWVNATGIPRFRVQFDVKPRGNEFLVSGKLEQAGVDDVFTAPVPLYASRAGEKPQKLGVVITTGPETRFHFVSRFRPTHLAIDPHLTLLCRTD